MSTRDRQLGYVSLKIAFVKFRRTSSAVRSVRPSPTHLLAAMACAVLDRGGVINLGLPPTAFWLALAMTCLTLLANAASQSRPERMLWVPITLAMAVAAVGVAWL